jgi:hypothetical protein
MMMLFGSATKKPEIVTNEDPRRQEPRVADRNKKAPAAAIPRTASSPPTAAGYDPSINLTKILCTRGSRDSAPSTRKGQMIILG